MSVSGEARKDAREFARAKMYYGEGAGIRRRLIEAKVDSKSHSNPNYARAFRAELDRQDMADHAVKASRERRRRDVTETASKNAKGLLTGNTERLSSGVLVVAVVGYFAHQTGLDKVVWDKSKSVYGDVKARYKARRAVKHVDNVYDITNIRKK